MVGEAPTANPVHDRLGMDDAHELARGAGTAVAVIDSGVVAPDGMRLVVWPAVTVTLVEPVSGRSEGLNPNLIGMSNGRIAMHVNAR